MKKPIVAAFLLLAIAVNAYAQKISLNEVNAIELHIETGIPIEEAEKIIAFRKWLGQFTSFSQLDQVPDLDPAVAEQIKDDAGITLTTKD